MGETWSNIGLYANLYHTKVATHPLKNVLADVMTTESEHWASLAG